VLKNLKVFAEMCGQKAMPNVVMATTMWGKLIDKKEGEAREEELKGDFWKEMITNGCTIERFEDTHESAWNIIDSLAEKNCADVLLPHELVDVRLRLNETKAGIALTKVLEKLLQDKKDAARRFRKLAQRKQDNALVAQELNEIEENIIQTVEQLKEELGELKIPVARRVWLLLTGKWKKSWGA
jgi:hypothetical protein